MFVKSEDIELINLDHVVIITVDSVMTSPNNREYEITAHLAIDRIGPDEERVRILARVDSEVEAEKILDIIQEGFRDNDGCADLS